MVLYPDVQRKAQAELDRVVGDSRLPDFGDRDALPYLEAVVMEVYRYVELTSVILFASYFDDTADGALPFLLVSTPAL